MFKNIKWLRVTPDRAGLGGNKTGYHSFQQQPLNDIRACANVHIYRGSWRRDYETVGYPNPQSWDLGATSAPTIHGYVYPSLTDPSAVPNLTVLGQTISGSYSHFWDFTHGTVRSLRPAQGVYVQPATFVNINQRCFAGDGLAEAVIMDDRTPAIHAQPNQNLGIDAPQQPLPLTNAISYTSLGAAYSTLNSKFVNSPNPNSRISTIVTTDTVFCTHVNANLLGYSLFGSPASSVGPGFNPTVNGKTSNSATFTAAGTISITTGTSLVTLTGSTWPADGEYCGLAINFNGYSFVISETLNIGGNWDINGNAIVLSNTKLLIWGVYDGPTLTNVPYTITGAQFKMGVAATSLSLPTAPQTLGYGQSSMSNMVQCLVNATQVNGFYRNLGNIALGPVGGGVPDTVTDIKFGPGLTQLTSVSAPWVSTDVGKTIVLDHCGDAAGTTMLVTTITATAGASEIGVLSPNANAGVILNGRGWWVSNAIGVSDATMAGGTAVVTSASNPWTPNDVGKEILVAQAGVAGHGSNDALFGHILTFTNTGSITLDVNCNVGGVTGVQAYWGGALSGTHTGPSYAYAWYDPETGHMSNISPTFTIPRPQTQGNYADFANLTAVFNIDPGLIAYPSGYNYTNPSGDAIRFSHIMFFRTLSIPGSSTLYPIGSLTPFVGKVHPGSVSTRGSWNPTLFGGWMGLPNEWVIPGAAASQQWYDFSSDSDLLLSGGFRAPQYTNSKPMALLRGGATQPSRPYLIAYWDRRTWIIDTQEPNKVRFSCDEAQCPLGVPEESFPPTNFLRLPSSADAKGLGMRTVGDMLLITTQQFAYIVAGNNESNYRLMKVSSSMPGVGQFQMDEFPTYAGAEGEPTTVFFLGRDRIVYRWVVGGQVTPISGPIQDQLDSILSSGNRLSLYQQSRVHCVSAWGRRFVMVYPVQAAQATMYLYDVDNQVWTRSFFSDGAGGTTNFAGTVSFTTIHGLDIPTNEIYALFTPTISNVILRSWVRDDTATAIQNVFIQTFPLNFDGAKTRKQLVALNIHATAGTWQGYIVVDESIDRTTTPTFGPFPDPLYSVYGTNPLPVDGAGCQDSVILAGQFTATGEPLVGYRFQVGVQTIGNDMTVGRIFAIDVGFIDMEDPGDGDP